MEKYFLVRHFNVLVNDKVMIHDLSFSITKSMCVLGESGTGKSKLLKELQKVRDYKGVVSFYLGQTSSIKSNLSLEESDSYTKEFLELFLSNKKNLGYKYALLSKVLTHPDYFFCEDLHNILTNYERRLFFQYLKHFNILIFYVTNEVNDTVYFDYLVVLKNNRVAMEGNTLDILKEEKLMKLLGFSLPFYVNMSIQLGYYGVIRDVCLTKEELGDKLWKKS